MSLILRLHPQESNLEIAELESTLTQTRYCRSLSIHPLCHYFVFNVSVENPPRSSASSYFHVLRQHSQLPDTLTASDYRPTARHNLLKRLAFALTQYRNWYRTSFPMHRLTPTNFSVRLLLYRSEQKFVLLVRWFKRQGTDPPLLSFKLVRT